MLQSYAKRAEGVAITTMPYGEIMEYQTFTCAHCQTIVNVIPGADGPDRQNDGSGLCLICMGLTCKRCQLAQSKGAPCVPWEKMMEQIEARDIALRSYGI
ncbi:MAG TPA: hypothetical protein VGR34_06120 [Candidatus Dormibacteraeota bacterium]|nr:hypothetical protein [Candidatus Dormibacteraeota bacterium]